MEFAAKGYGVTGIDYIKSNIETARSACKNNNLKNVIFVEDDCRFYHNEKKAGLVVCLYDVIGSFSREDDNYSIIKTLYSLLKKDGYVVASVMNYDSTLSNAENTFSFKNDPNKLLKLSASDTQEKTGNVFNPKYYIVDTDTHLVYRKEQFAFKNELPTELIVRDKRYTLEEITGLFKKVGFTILEVKYTNASDWNKSYDKNNKRAKEILIIGKKE